MHKKITQWFANTDNVFSLSQPAYKTKPEENTTGHFSSRGGKGKEQK